MCLTIFGASCFNPFQAPLLKQHGFLMLSGDREREHWHEMG